MTVLFLDIPSEQFLFALLSLSLSVNSKAQGGKWLIREWCHYFVYYLPLIFIIILIFIASLPFYLLCQFLKSEADIVEVTVMEVYREEKSVRRVRAGSKSISDRLFILWQ